jgi:hypothetical protein
MADDQTPQQPSELEELLHKLATPILASHTRVGTIPEGDPRLDAIQTTVKATLTIIDKLNEMEGNPGVKINFAGHEVYFEQEKGWQRVCPHQNCEEPIHDIDREKVAILAAIDLSIQVLAKDNALVNILYPDRDK